MPALRVACALPQGIDLPAGRYGREGRSQLKLIAAIGASAGPEVLGWDNLTEERWNSLTEAQWNRLGESLPLISMPIEAEDTLNKEQTEIFREKSARQLLRHVNLLIRWYRAEMQATAIREMTLAQASPFHFLLDPGGSRWGEFIAGPFTVPSAVEGSTTDAVHRVIEGFRSGIEPPVEVLLLLDARQALSEGRFREAVLFCWSVIDGTFNQKFESLVKARLADEWKDSRDFLVGNDFGLRHKMSLGMRLVAGRSLTREADDFWLKLDRSYKNRNTIIHEGAIASEDDAQAAIWVAERVVAIMKSV